jgi:hypothetical protein
MASQENGWKLSYDDESRREIVFPVLVLFHWLRAMN